ncbi:MAG: hypothetical protein ACOZIN_14705 [Myxococcota bacterium]
MPESVRNSARRRLDLALAAASSSLSHWATFCDSSLTAAGSYVLPPFFERDEALAARLARRGFGFDALELFAATERASFLGDERFFGMAAM